MTCRILYSPSARKDLDDVWDGVFEASGSYDIADRYVHGIISEFAEKKDFPKSGIPLCYRGLFTGFYSVNFKAYKGFYRLKDGNIEVARILLAKCDYLTILFGEPEE